MHIHSSLHIDNFIRSIIMGFKGTRYLYKIWFVHLCFICYKISFFWSIYFQSLNCWCSFADQVTWAFNVISMGKLFIQYYRWQRFYVGDFTNLVGISFFIYISFISQRSYGARFKAHHKDLMCRISWTFGGDLWFFHFSTHVRPMQ